MEAEVTPQEPVQAEATPNDAPTPEPAQETPQGALEGGGEPTGEPAPFDLEAMRQQMAGGDEKLLNELKRYRSAEAIGKALRDAKVAAKQKQSPLSLGEDATEEEVKAFREAMGIPEEAKDYPINWRDGYEPNEFDNAMLDDFKGFMHGKNIDPKTAQAAMEWYQENTQVIEQTRNEAMANRAEQTQEHFRSIYGAEYKGNMAAANELIKTQLGEEGYQDFLQMRLENGERLQDQPFMVEMLVNLGTEYYGSNAIVNGDIETTSKTLEERKQELLALRATDEKKYNSSAVQEEIAKIYTQLNKINSRK